MPGTPGECHTDDISVNTESCEECDNQALCFQCAVGDINNDECGEEGEKEDGIREVEIEAGEIGIDTDPCDTGELHESKEESQG